MVVGRTRAGRVPVGLGLSVVPSIAAADQAKADAWSGDGSVPNAMTAGTIRPQLAADWPW